MLDHRGDVAGGQLVRPRRAVLAVAVRPSRMFQPKLAPRPHPAARGTKSISSISFWPTSPIARSPRQPVEGEAERVAQAHATRRWARPRRTGCRRGRAAAPGRTSRRSSLPSWLPTLWPLPSGSPPPPAIAGAGVEHRVGPEGELAAVVVLVLSCAMATQRAPRRRVGDLRVGRAAAELVDDDVAGPLRRGLARGVVGVEAAAGGVVRARTRSTAARARPRARRPSGPGCGCPGRAGSAGSRQPAAAPCRRAPPRRPGGCRAAAPRRTPGG